MTPTDRIRELEARVDGLVRARAMHLQEIAEMKAEIARLSRSGLRSTTPETEGTTC